MTNALPTADLIARRLAIGELLQQFAWLWRPVPYKEQAPTWCGEAPQLAASLSTLDNSQLQTLLTEPDALTHFMVQHIPTLGPLWSASHLPACDVGSPPTVDSHFIRDIPGRKWQQIAAFTQAIRPVNAPVLDWCGGKGHLAACWGARGAGPSPHSSTMRLCVSTGSYPLAVHARHLLRPPHNTAEYFDFGAIGRANSSGAKTETGRVRNNDPRRSTRNNNQRTQREQRISRAPH